MLDVLDKHVIERNVNALCRPFEVDVVKMHWELWISVSQNWCEILDTKLYGSTNIQREF